MTILMKEVLPIAEPETYKLHFSRWNGINEPLDVWVRDKREAQKWQEYRPANNAFNRNYIFSLIRFYHEPDTWLFGGVFEVLRRLPDRYEVNLTRIGAGFVGRLKLRSSYRERATRVNLEKHYLSLEVQEVLREPYTGRSFPGFEDIDLSFGELEALVRNSRPDWNAALASIKGIYLITDQKTGKRYVGSAYGSKGVWSRWCNYAETGHGGNAELRALMRNPTLEYCREAFHFALLEHRPSSTSDEVIISREKFWKHVLLARGEFGLNRN